MLFSPFDLILIIAGAFYYIVMGFGFVRNVNKAQGHSFSSIDLAVIALWPVFMFLESLFGFFEGIK